MNEARTRLAFQIVPELVGAKNERDVVGSFEVGLPDNTRSTVRRSLVMRRGELVQPDTR